MLHTYREDLLSQQARAERLATFGQPVGSIGHELRNPLGVIESSLYILKGRIGEDERAQKHATRITEQVAMANDIVTKLLDMIRDRPLAKEFVQVGEVVRDAGSALAWPPEVRLVADGMEALPAVAADRVQLRQVFLNLLENALHAASPRGEVNVSASVADGVVAVAVEDSGPGVDPSLGNRLFEPLMTTKVKGIGLGLALVKRIVERHGGTIVHQPRVPHGARFVVRLPLGDKN